MQSSDIRFDRVKALVEERVLGQRNSGGFRAGLFLLPMVFFYFDQSTEDEDKVGGIEVRNSHQVSQHQKEPRPAVLLQNLRGDLPHSNICPLVVFVNAFDHLLDIEIVRSAFLPGRWNYR